MIHRVTKLLVSVTLLMWMVGSYTDVSGQAERAVDEWIRDSILKISYKVREFSREYEDPFFVPSVLMGPIITRTSRHGGTFYESQFDLLLRNSIYLKLAAGLAPVDMKVLDADLLPKVIAESGLSSTTRFNAEDIASSYAQNKAMRQCVNRLLDVADMIVLGQTTLKTTEAVTTFRILRMQDDRLYLDRTSIDFRVLPDIPDISMNIEKDGIRKMMEFPVSDPRVRGDAEMQRAVGNFVRQFADAWAEGDINRMMSYYDKEASAVTMTVNEDSRVDLTNVLDREALHRFWITSIERYRTVDFDYSTPRIFDVKRNSKNIVSCSVDFCADLASATGGTQRLPLLSLYIQLRRAGVKGWKIYFQRIKEVPKYHAQSLESW